MLQVSRAGGGGDDGGGGAVGDDITMVFGQAEFKTIQAILKDAMFSY